MSDFKKHLEESLRDPEFKKEYDALEAQYDFARQVIEARTSKGMSQADLARRIKTSQANISKLEHGTMNPSIRFAAKVAKGLGKTVRISLK